MCSTFLGVGRVTHINSVTNLVQTRITPHVNRVLQHSRVVERLRENLADFNEKLFKNLYQDSLDGPITGHVLVQILSEKFHRKIGQVFPQPLYHSSVLEHPIYMWGYTGLYQVGHITHRIRVGYAAHTTKCTTHMYDAGLKLGASAFSSGRNNPISLRIAYRRVQRIIHVWVMHEIPSRSLQSRRICTAHPEHVNVRIAGQSG